MRLGRKQLLWMLGSLMLVACVSAQGEFRMHSDAAVGSSTGMSCLFNSLAAGSLPNQLFRATLRLLHACVGSCLHIREHSVRHAACNDKSTRNSRKHRIKLHRLPKPQPCSSAVQWTRPQVALLDQHFSATGMCTSSVFVAVYRCPAPGRIPDHRIL